MKNVYTGDNVTQYYKDNLTVLIRKYWDCFCVRGTRRTILDYEFSIDTGASKLFFCQLTTYEPHGNPITMDQISSLLDNNWIEGCGDSWGSMIVIAAKPYQEHIMDIKKSI